MTRLATWIHPELSRIPPARRERALREARRMPFDVFELLGMAVGAIVTALFLRYAVPPVGGTLAELAALAAVFALAIGPFLIRRTRRGLRGLRAAR